MYEKEIKDLVYAFGGNKETDDEILEKLETEVFTYMKSLVESLEKVSNKITCQTILDTLEGKAEKYCAKRCLMLELARKKLDKALEAEAGDDLEAMGVDGTEENPDCEDSDSESDLHNFDMDVFNMDDGTEAYRQYYQLMVRDLKDADELTLRMDTEEYMEFSNCAKTTFVFRKPSKFREWLNIKNKPKREALAILGWLASYRLRRLVQASLDRRENLEIKNPLFGAPRYLLRECDLKMEDYFPRAKDAKSIDDYFRTCDQRHNDSHTRWLALQKGEKPYIW